MHRSKCTPAEILSLPTVSAFLFVFLSLRLPVNVGKVNVQPAACKKIGVCNLTVLLQIVQMPLSRLSAQSHWHSLTPMYLLTVLLQWVISNLGYDTHFLRGMYRLTIQIVISYAKTPTTAFQFTTNEPQPYVLGWRNHPLHITTWLDMLLIQVMWLFKFWIHLQMKRSGIIVTMRIQISKLN